MNWMRLQPTRLFMLGFFVIFLLGLIAGLKKEDIIWGFGIAMIGEIVFIALHIIYFRLEEEKFVNSNDTFSGLQDKDTMEEKFK